PGASAEPLQPNRPTARSAASGKRMHLSGSEQAMVALGETEAKGESLIRRRAKQHGILVIALYPWSSEHGHQDDSAPDQTGWANLWWASSELGE
ncbi:MAG: hypothetical protein WBM47_06825, partial [Polyangiales bacterium]